MDTVHTLSEIEEGNTGSMHDDGTQDEEIDDRLDVEREIVVRTLRWYIWCRQLLERQGSDKDGSYSHGSYRCVGLGSANAKGV